jgi:flagellar assembly protein FliH
MSSRLLRSADAAGAAPIEWRHAGGSRPPPGAAQRDHGNHRDSDFGDTEKEVHARLEAARQQARAEGEAAGVQRASQRLEPVMAGLHGVLEELTQQRQHLRREAEEDTVQLAIAIARRVLHRELATDPEAMLGLVKAAFSKLNSRETHRLRVSPVDAAALEEQRGRLELPPGLEIARDPSLAPGSAVFETSRGELDASVDTQMAEIERGLTDVMRRRAQ